MRPGSRPGASRRQRKRFNNYFTFLIICNAMTHKSPKSPKCVPISSLAFFFIAIFLQSESSYPRDKCVIDTILSVFTLSGSSQKAALVVRIKYGYSESEDNISMSGCRPQKALQCIAFLSLVGCQRHTSRMPGPGVLARPKRLACRWNRVPGQGARPGCFARPSLAFRWFLNAAHYPLKCQR